MIVVLVYRPEAVSGAGLGERPHKEAPFEGIEIYGIYYPAESKAVDTMVTKLADENPAWKFHIDGDQTLKVGLSVHGR